MKRKRILLFAGVLAFLGALFYFYLGSSTPKGQSPLARLKPGNLTPLKNAFNQSSASVRVVVMLSPT